MPAFSFSVYQKILFFNSEAYLLIPTFDRFLKVSGKERETGIIKSKWALQECAVISLGNAITTWVVMVETE